MLHKLYIRWRRITTMHWISWETLSKPKALDGLGFRNMHDFNIAMLSKQGWRLLQSPDSLCARILKARYFPHCTMLEAEPREGISYSWRSILHGLELVKQGYIWRIGDGSRINIHHDNWIPRKGSLRPLGHIYIHGTEFVT